MHKDVEKNLVNPTKLLPSTGSLLIHMNYYEQNSNFHIRLWMKTHKVVSDAKVENHFGAFVGWKELLLKSLHKITAWQNFQFNRDKIMSVETMIRYIAMNVVHIIEGAHSSQVW